MNVLKNLLNSEKAVTGAVLVVGATVLAAMKLMPVADWQNFALWIYGIYAGGKTVQGAVEKLTKGKKE